MFYSPKKTTNSPFLMQIFNGFNLKCLSVFKPAKESLSLLFNLTDSSN